MFMLLAVCWPVMPTAICGTVGDYRIVTPVSKKKKIFVILVSTGILLFFYRPVLKLVWRYRVSAIMSDFQLLATVECVL
jgi:hypothetical protein